MTTTNFAQTVIDTKVANFKTFATKCRKGGFSSLTYKKEVKMLKGTKNAPSPFRDKKVEVIVQYSNITVGNDYKKLMERAQKAIGETALYNVDKPSGKTPIQGFERFLLVSDKDSSKYYARIFKTKNTKTKTVCYLIDGFKANAAEIELIKQFQAKTSSAPKICPKQAENNVTEPKLNRFVADLLLNGIVEIGQKNLYFVG